MKQLLLVLAASVALMAQQGPGPNQGPGPGNNPDCPKANSIGIVEVKNKNTQQILRREYACRGQMLESSSTEIIELYLRTGEKIIVLENSAIVVE